MRYCNMKCELKAYAKVIVANLIIAAAVVGVMLWSR